MMAVEKENPDSLSLRALSLLSLTFELQHLNGKIALIFNNGELDAKNIFGPCIHHANSSRGGEDYAALFY
jgi:hypothetical protein